MKHIVYKIIFPTNETYVGQAKIHQYIRWGQHIADCARGVHGNKRMQEIYNEYGCDEWVFEIIESIEHDDKDYVNLVENMYIQTTPNTINSRQIKGDPKMWVGLTKKEKKRKQDLESYHRRKQN